MVKTQYWQGQKREEWWISGIETYYKFDWDDHHVFSSDCKSNVNFPDANFKIMLTKSLYCN